MGRLILTYCRIKSRMKNSPCSSWLFPNRCSLPWINQTNHPLGSYAVVLVLRDSGTDVTMISGSWVSGWSVTRRQLTVGKKATCFISTSHFWPAFHLLIIPSSSGGFRLLLELRDTGGGGQIFILWCCTCRMYVAKITKWVSNFCFAIHLSLWF